MKSVMLAMALFTLVGAITPGPVNVLAMRHGLASRFATPFAYVLGASTSYTAVVGLTGLGAGRLLQQPDVISVGQWAGAAYLAYLAWRIATAPVAKLQDGIICAASPVRAFVEGGLTQGLNPKAWLVALSGVSLFVLPQSRTDAALAAFCSISLLLCGVGVGSWAVAGRLLTRWLVPEGRQRMFNRLLGAMLALTVVGMLA